MRRHGIDQLLYISSRVGKVRAAGRCVPQPVIMRITNVERSFDHLAADEVDRRAAPTRIAARCPHKTTFARIQEISPAMLRHGEVQW
jgi:hypothetical protein